MTYKTVITWSHWRPGDVVLEMDIWDARVIAQALRYAAQYTDHFIDEDQDAEDTADLLRQWEAEMWKIDNAPLKSGNDGGWNEDSSSES